MFFYLSKIFWMVAQPSTLILLVLLAGVAMLALRWRRVGGALCGLAALGLLVAGYLPSGMMLLAPLENRFSRPPADLRPDVILVLGGGLDAGLTQSRGVVTLTDGGGRVTEAAALARRFPEARVVFSGGDGQLVQGGPPEAGAAAKFLAEMGVSADRISYETRSRNTYENAIFTRDKFHPRADERWFLVTSAYHMPRSVGIFRKAGVAVVPYPAQYFTAPHGFPQMGVAYGLRMTDIAMREWVGLLAYWLTDRTDSLFPGPDQASGGSPSR